MEEAVRFLPRYEIRAPQRNSIPIPTGSSTKTGLSEAGNHSSSTNSSSSFPKTSRRGTLYISIRFATFSHLCPCGCKNKVVTPLHPTYWKLTFDGKTVSLYPSVGNWSFPCHSHYWVSSNKVHWPDRWSQAGSMQEELTNAAQRRSISAASRARTNAGNPGAEPRDSAAHGRTRGSLVEEAVAVAIASRARPESPPARRRSFRRLTQTVDVGLAVQVHGPAAVCPALGSRVLRPCFLRSVSKRAGEIPNRAAAWLRVRTRSPRSARVPPASARAPRAPDPA